MLNYDFTLVIAEKVIQNIPSPFFFSNGKTVVSVDFGVCGFMKKKNNKYTSDVCKGCYSTILLNVYPGLRSKLEGLPSPSSKGELEKFHESLKLLKAWVPKLERIRFYSFADFQPSHMPYIRLAAQYFQVDIISKILTMHKNETFLRELLTVENVWLSLSFNEDFCKHIEKVAEVIKDSDRAQLNYTINYEKENPDTLPFRHLISVWHIKNDRKRYMVEQGRFASFKETNVCGMFDGDGNRNKWEWKKVGKANRVKETKGSCHACNNCKCSLKMKLQGIEPSLPEKLMA